MKINVERLLDVIIECYAAEEDYTRSSREYYKAYGRGVNLDRARSTEEQHIVHAYHTGRAACDAVSVALDVLGLCKEERSRAYRAAKALREWYHRTEWERCAPDNMLEALTRYITQ